MRRTFTNEEEVWVSEQSAVNQVRNVNRVQRYYSVEAEHCCTGSHQVDVVVEGTDDSCASQRHLHHGDCNEFSRIVACNARKPMRRFIIIKEKKHPQHDKDPQERERR